MKRQNRFGILKCKDVYIIVTMKIQMRNDRRTAFYTKIYCIRLDHQRKCIFFSIQRKNIRTQPCQVSRFLTSRANKVTPLIL